MGFKSSTIAIGIVLGSAASAAPAAVLIDFGSDPGKVAATGVSYFGNGNAGGGTRTLTTDADYIQFAGTFSGSGTFQTQGTTFNVGSHSLAGFSPNDKVAISTTFAPPHQTDGNLLDYFRLVVIFRNSATGQLNSFRIHDGVTGNAPFNEDGTFALVEDANSSLGRPEGTNETPLTTFDQIQLIYQNADDPAVAEGPQSFSWRIDSIEIVPEPSGLALAGVAGLGLLRRRRPGAARG